MLINCVCVFNFVCRFEAKSSCLGNHSTQITRIAFPNRSSLGITLTNSVNFVQALSRNNHNCIEFNKNFLCTHLRRSPPFILELNAQLQTSHKCPLYALSFLVHLINDTGYLCPMHTPQFLP